MKRATVSATFSELPAAHCFQQASGEGSTASVAIGRAIDNLFKLERVKGRRVETIRLDVTVRNVRSEDSPETD